jgi:hypothetical protein
MDPIKIIQKVITDNNLNVAQLAKAIEVHPTIFYEINSKKVHRISAQLAKKINKKFPQYSLDYLLTGKEEYKLPLPTFDELWDAPGNCGIASIHGGDKLAIRVNNDYIVEGLPYVVQLKDGVRIIRHVYSLEDSLKLTSDDNVYPEMEVPRSDVENLYRIVAQVRM